jgi:hypothetical protein
MFLFVLMTSGMSQRDAETIMRLDRKRNRLASESHAVGGRAVPTSPSLGAALLRTAMVTTPGR